MPRPRLRNRRLDRAGRQPVDRRARRQLARLDADHLPVRRPRRGQVGFGGQHRGAAGRQPRLRLRDVGARHLADIEAVAHLAQLLLQHFDVAALQIEDCAVAQQIHVGGRRREQHVLLGQPQVLARRRDLTLGLPGPIAGLETVEQGLRDGAAIDLHGLNSGRGDAVAAPTGGRVTCSRYCSWTLAVALTRGR